MTPTAAQPEAAGKIRVLVIEDDRFLQKILLMKFQSEGFDVRGASDGEEGLKMMLADPPDLVVLDLILPKMNGFEVLTEMRTSVSTKEIPVVVLSNLGQDEDIRRVMELGALEFLVKSNHSIMEVVGKVKEAYARHLNR
ncbi:response regulator [Candidatus Uhrbacteria bacterium]|nr:response regulator [Candidatus Uhrbacteria bacterium]